MEWIKQKVCGGGGARAPTPRLVPGEGARGAVAWEGHVGWPSYAGGEGRALGRTHPMKDLILALGDSV